MNKQTLTIKLPAIVSFIIILMATAPLIAQKKKSYLSFEENGSLKTNISGNNIKASITHSAATNTELSVQIPGAILHSIPFQSDTLHRLYIEGLTPFGEDGAPELPAKNIIVNIEQGSQPTLEIIAIDTITLDHINVIPNIDPEANLMDKLPAIYPNAHYTKNAFYPKKWIEVIDVQTLKNQSIAIVQIHPIRFNPVTKQIKVARHLSFKMHQSILKKRNVKTNSNQVPSYLILAPEGFQEAAHKFSTWKNKTGYHSTVQLKEKWTPQLIKAAVKKTYQENQNSLDYLLLIGDHEIMPAEEKYREEEDEMKLYVTDLYYTCMDGEDDYLPDMAYGRLPVSSLTEATQMVNKMIDFSINPPISDDYYQTIIGCAQFQDEKDGIIDGYADRRFIQTSEDVGHYLKDKGYIYKRLYYAKDDVTPEYYNDGKYSSGGAIPVELLRKNGFKWDADAPQIIESINAGSFFTFHRDHGKKSGLGWSHPEYTTEDVAMLNNATTPTFLYSINCHSGKFNIPESFAEAMLLHPMGGAIAAFCASNTSFSGYNDAMFVAMVDAIWNEPGIVPELGPDNHTTLKEHESITKLGDILNYGKLRMLEQWSGSMDTHQHIFELFHLLGDPSMHMPTHQPVQINVTTPNWFSTSDTELDIQSSNCSNGYVTISDQQNQILFTGSMNNGSIIAPIANMKCDSLELVISQKGYTPFITTIRQSKPLLSYPQMVNLSTIDQTSFPYTHTIKLANVGKGLLTIDSISCSNSNISTNKTQNIRLEENTSAILDLHITEAISGNHLDTLFIHIKNSRQQIPIHYKTCKLISASEINGYWSKNNSPYVINAHTQIKPGAELIIEAGTKIIFKPEAQLTIQGNMQALGTENSPIVFTSEPDNTCMGIQLFDGAEHTSIFKHCHFINNIAQDENSVVHIQNYDNVTFDNCQFLNNTSRNGGAVYVTESQAAFNNCRFDNNTASFGGALYLLEADVTISNTYFTNNKSTLYNGSGGAIYCKTSNPIIEGSVFYNNYAAFAGAVYMRDNSKGLLVNNTFTSNLSNYGAGIRFKAEASTEVYNSIFWNNEAFTNGKEIYTYEDCEPSFTNCIIKGGKEKIKVYKDYLFNGQLTDCFENDPLFRDPINNDFRISPNSPAKDKGMKQIKKFQFNTSDIQMGERIRYETIDIGAYEFQNYAPHQINISCDSILKSLEKDRFLGTLTSTDRDLEDQHTYTLMGADAERYLRVSNDSVYTQASLQSLSADSIIFMVKTTDSGFEKLAYQKRMALKLSDQKLGLTKSLSPIRTTHYPKDTLINLSEYFITTQKQADLQFQIGDPSNSLIANAYLQANRLNLRYKEIGRTYLPLSVTHNEEIHNLQIAIEVWGPNAVNELTQKPITLFPNPCQDQLFLESHIHDIQGQIQIEIYDINGTLLLSQVKSGRTPINVSQLSSAIYVLQITTVTNKVVRQLFIKEK